MIKLDKLKGTKSKTLNTKVVTSPEYIISTEDSFDKKRNKECVNIKVLRVFDGRIVLSIKTTRYDNIDNILKKEKMFYGTTITKIINESTYDKK